MVWAAQPSLMMTVAISLYQNTHREASHKRRVREWMKWTLGFGGLVAEARNVEGTDPYVDAEEQREFPEWGG